MTTGSHKEASVAIPSRSSLSESDIYVCNTIGKVKNLLAGGPEGGGWCCAPPP